MNKDLTMQVSELDEHELVRLILSVLSKYQTSQLVVQPGDDAAVLPGLTQPTITADLLIEDVHFQTNWSSAADIGTRAAAANLADLIAMGARPTALTVSLGLPATTQVGYVIELIEAISAEASLTSAQVVGGDVTKSEKLVVSITAVGDCETRRPILRSGAVVGNLVGLIGRIGHAQAGLELLTAGLTKPAGLIAAHQRPIVSYQAGIAAWPVANAMIDVSDGLLVDLGHIARASSVAMSLSSAQLENLVSPDLVAAAAALRVDPVSMLLSGGDDHAFIVVAPVLPEGTKQIGEVKSGSGVWLDNQPAQLLGYRHFSG